MAGIPLPNGAKVAIATALAAAKAITGISNANPAVVSSAGHTLQNGGIVLLSTPAWLEIDSQVRRAAAVDAGTFALEGLDTTDDLRFPEGEGAGTFQAITGWTQLPLIPTFEKTGGEPKTQTSSYLDVEKEREQFTGTTAERLNFTMSYAPEGPAHAALLTQSRAGDMVVIRLTLKNGDTLYYPGQLHFNPVPTTGKDNEMVVSGAIALQADITRFAKA